MTITLTLHQNLDPSRPTTFDGATIEDALTNLHDYLIANPNAADNLTIFGITQNPNECAYISYVPHLEKWIFENTLTPDSSGEFETYDFATAVDLFVDAARSQGFLLAIRPPAYLEIDMLTFIDGLRTSGDCNVLEAWRYLQRVFPNANLSEAQAKAISVYWIKTFDMRHPPEPATANEEVT